MIIPPFPGNISPKVNICIDLEHQPFGDHVPFGFPPGDAVFLSTGAGRRSQGAVPLDGGWSIWDDMVLIHQNRSRKNWAEETHWGHGVTKYPIQDICSRPFRWKSEVSAKVDTEEAHRKEVEKEAEDLKQQFFGRNHGAILGHTARMISWDGGDFWYQLAMNNEFNSWG